MSARAIMGRPKKSRETPEPETKTVGLRVTLEYDQWLQGLARHYRTTVAGVIDRALAEWSESEEYPERPPDRTP
jgi:hypothetical protein